MITEVTRREIIDFLTASRYHWSGRLEEPEFLRRLFDLESLPSYDPRFKTASGDIWQHRVLNLDWPDDWVLYDDRFDLLHGRDEEFLRFLCEVVHPVVVASAERATELVTAFNRELANDGWELFVSQRMSSRPVFAARKVNERAEAFTEPTGWPKVDRQVEEIILRLREASSEEQFQAVGLMCREALISLAQAVFLPGTHHSPDNVDPCDADARRMLEAYISSVARGSSNEEIRVHAKAALKLALALQHDRAADFRAAALCAEATCSLVNIIAILAGRRGAPHCLNGDS